TKLVELAWKDGQRPTVAEVISQLLLEYPQLQSLAQRSRWAINDDFVELNAVVRVDDRIAMVPPVSGG
ncbi:MAG: MoaD/ThiS family protein, partial [Pirellulales bacterium]